MPQADAQIAIPSSHPALPGHFPGRPIVPGVLLLDAVMQAIAAQPGATTPMRLLRAKFMAPVPPDAEVTIQLRRCADGNVAFTCHCEGRVALRGEFG